MSWSRCGPAATPRRPQHWAGWAMPGTSRWITGHRSIASTDRTDRSTSWHPRAPTSGSGRTVLAVPGSRSALNRTIGYQTPGGATIRIPDLASALSLKGAAHRTPSANPVRHLQDAVTLFACAHTARLVISKSMRTNINHLLAAFDDPEAWAFTDPANRRRAIRAIRSLRTDWTPPPAVLPRRPGRDQ